MSFSYHRQGMGFSGYGLADVTPPPSDAAISNAAFELAQREARYRQAAYATWGTGWMIGMGIFGLLTTGLILYGGYKLIQAVSRR